MEVSFVVEHAGCATCAERVRNALAAFGELSDIEIDEADDSASVRGDLSPTTSVEVVSEALSVASEGSGHEYRVRPGSWHTAAV